MVQELGTIIARRAYFGAKTEDAPPVVEVEIGKPLPSPHAADEFMCSFRIRSDGTDRTETVFGIDELQALQLALGYLKAKLRKLSEASYPNLHWVGDQGADFGIRIPEL